MSNHPRVAVVGTFDTKGPELAFLAEVIRAEGAAPVLVDCGVLGEPGRPVDVTAAQVAEASGMTLEALRQDRSRVDAISLMGKGAETVLARFVQEGSLQGMVGAGGSNGATLAAIASRALPFGLPKVLVTTMASASAEALIQGTDVTLMYPLVDIEGLNVLSRTVLRRAGAAVAAMAKSALRPDETYEAKPVVAATMSGVVTKCVHSVRLSLEAMGDEVIVFHANGAGGRSYEQFILSGRVEACIDLSLTELADQFGGGLFDAGDNRLEAAATIRVPHVVCPGGADMIKFGARSTVPEQFVDRLIIPYNENVTLMRANVNDSMRIGSAIGKKLRGSGAIVVLPHGGLSQLDTPGEKWYSPEANEALFAAIKSELASEEIAEAPSHVNDDEFSELLVAILTERRGAARATRITGSSSEDDGARTS